MKLSWIDPEDGCLVEYDVGGYQLRIETASGLPFMAVDFSQLVLMHKMATAMDDPWEKRRKEILRIDKTADTVVIILQQTASVAAPTGEPKTGEDQSE